MATTAGASAAIRKVFQLLEDNFDDQEGRYKNGYSDERIAKETGLSITAIHDHRVGAFGKIKPPSELKALRTELEELQRLYIKSDEEYRKQLDDLRRRIKAVESKYD